MSVRPLCVLLCTVLYRCAASGLAASPPYGAPDRSLPTAEQVRACWFASETHRFPLAQLHAAFPSLDCVTVVPRVAQDLPQPAVHVAGLNGTSLETVKFRQRLFRNIADQPAERLPRNQQNDYSSKVPARPIVPSRPLGNSIMNNERRQKNSHKSVVPRLYRYVTVSRSEKNEDKRFLKKYGSPQASCFRYANGQEHAPYTCLYSR
jgi:hypothetical protein